MKAILLSIMALAGSMVACTANTVEKDAAAIDNETEAVSPMDAASESIINQGTDNTAPSSYGLLTGTLNELSNDTIFRADSKVNMLTVLDFNAVWCGPCRTFSPVFEQAAKAHKQVMFVSVDVDKMPLTAHAFGISSIPTVIFIKPDGTITRYVGLEDIYPASKFNDLIVSQMSIE